MCCIDTVNEYLAAGKSLTPLQGKRPILDDWTNEKVSDEDILAHKGNLGMVIRDGFLVLDIDPKNDGAASFEKLTAHLREVTNENVLTLYPTVITPSGGFHIYMRIPDKYSTTSFRKTLKKTYPGIDFLTTGSQCVITSSSNNGVEYEWADDLGFDWEENYAPEALLDIYAKGERKQKSEGGDLGDFEGLLGGSGSDWPENRVIDMLTKLDPSMPNDEWVKVGMALNEWDPLDGLDLWETWSKDGDNYVEGETEKRWRSFDLGGGVTLGTISYMVKEVDYEENENVVQGYIDKISRADQKGLELDIAPEIKRSPIGLAGLERVAHAIQKRFKEIIDMRMPIAQCRQMVAPSQGNVERLDEEKPSWCDDWLYITNHGSFINMKDFSLCKSQAFNLINGKYVPGDLNGNKTSAVNYVSNYGFVEHVKTPVYMPAIDDKIVFVDGEKAVNVFNPATIPLEADEVSSEAQVIVDMVKRHIRMICGTDENAEILTQWLAHNIQFPGRKILWTPLIQSIEGAGKSFFGELLRICLGDRNVGTIGPKQASSDFNPWATDVVVNVLEELLLQGHNRYDAMNALKPLITDHMIQVNPKGINPYMTYNTTNYICFTNFKNALPVSETDRRWWVIFVDLDSLDDIDKVIGESYKTYFPKLFDGIRKHGPEIRRWLLDIELSSEFLNTKQAPMTEYKKLMVSTEEAGIEGYAEIKEMIMEGGQYYNSKCLSSSDLFEEVVFEHPDLDIQTSKRNLILKKMGFQQMPKLIKIDGKPRRIWVKQPMTNKEIRDILSDL